MRKLLGFVIAAGLVMLVTSAWAGLPSINTGSSTVNTVVNKGLDTAKNKAIEDSINKKIKSYNCAFKPDSTETTCPLDAVFSEIKKNKAPFEGMGIASVYVHILAGGSSSTLASNRASHVENLGESALGSWWKVSSNYQKENSNNLTIYVTSE